MDQLRLIHKGKTSNAHAYSPGEFKLIVVIYLGWIII